MTIYLVAGYLDLAATSLADAQSLAAALADPSTATNAATIDRVTAKLETLVQSDTGEPLVISSIDDANGTISSWVTDPSTTLIAALGDPDINNNSLYASTLSFSIVGNTRTGTLALNTDLLAAAVSRGRMQPPRASRFTLQLQKTTAGLTETVAYLSIALLPGVVQGTPSTLPAGSYVATTVARAGYVINASGITSLTGGGATTLDGQDAGSATYPLGCIVLTSDSNYGRLWRLVSGTLSATDLTTGKIKPTNYAAATPLYWQLI